jgi:hypothetical protein
MATQEQEVAKALELVKTINSYGWRVVMEIAEQSVKDAEEAVWACTKRDDRDDLVLKAQAARDFLATFKQRIESAKDITPQQKYQFQEVSTD